MGKNVVIIGSGAWGTAIAIHMARLGHKTSLYCRRSEIATAIQIHKKNGEYLPDIAIENVHATDDSNILKQANIVFVATPSHHMEMALKTLPISVTAKIVLCCKGICATSLRPLCEVAKTYFSNIFVLSGPTFAHEVAINLPTAVTLAGEDTHPLRHDIMSPNFRVYETTDMIGTCIFGACKNILAIACGICDGKALGNNAKAALITRGISEIQRLNIAVGGHPETVHDLCGIGDIIVTCSSPKSRNMSFGIDISQKENQGKNIADILKSSKTVIEGAINAQIVHTYAQKYNVYMPICTGVHQILNENTPIDSVIFNLLNTM